MTVKLVLLGHDRSYELIHIVREAFPQCVITDGDAEITVVSIVADNGITTRIISDIKQEEYFFPCEKNGFKSPSLGHSVCISFIKCAKKFGCRDIPWGALIGIRPSKMVLNLKNAGYNREQIRKTLTEIYEISDLKYDLMEAVAGCEAKLENDLPRNACCVYIGIPYCPSRCAYCSFLSRICSDGSTLDKYIECLISEMEIMKKYRDIKPSAIYIGGGTPTVLSACQLEKLLNGVDKFLNLEELKEYTVEAGRPDTVTYEKLKIIKEHGAGRISINPQTLNDKTLRLIGRRHSTADFYRAYEEALKCGFDVINTDLIAALPGEDTDDFRKSIEGIVKLSPENVTIHTLALKRAAELSSEGESDGRAGEMHKIAKERLKDYIPYYLYRQKNTVDNLENVGFCKEGSECIYNMCMMGDMRTVISFGAGGVSKTVDINRIKRIRNPKDADLYLKTINDIIIRKENEVVRHING